MEYQEALVGMAEVGIGLAGFVAILVAITDRDNPLGPFSSHFARLIVVNSLWILILSLAALGLLSTTLPEQTAWRIVSGLAVVLLTAVAILARIEGHRLTNPPNLLGRVVQTLAWVLGISAQGSLLINAIGAPLTPSFSLFFFGLLCMVMITAAEFLYLVYSLLRH